MKEWQKLGERLSKQIRPTTYPIAIKFFERIDNVPKGMRRPKVRVHGCSLFSLARRHGSSLVATVDDIACTAIAIFGFIEFSEDFINWYSDFLAPLYAKTREAAEKTVRSFPRIEYGKFSAITVSPLEKAKIEPDLIMVYMNPAQVVQVLVGLLKRSEKGMRLEFTFGDPLSTCSYGIAKAYNTKEVRIVIPGTGDRESGLTQDDELAVVIPIEKLSYLVSGIEESVKAMGRSYPVRMKVEVPTEINEYQKGLLRFSK